MIDIYTIEPSLENLISDENGEPEEARYIRWLRKGVAFYLMDHTPEQLKANWAKIRAKILDDHGYGPSNDC